MRPLVMTRRRETQALGVHMNSLRHTIVHEARLVALITSYFLVCFGTIALLKLLILAEYEVDATTAGGAAIAALVIGKVVIVLNKTRFGNRFERHAVWSSVLYKSVVYTFAVALVLSIEKLIHAYQAGEPWGATLQQALNASDSDRALATTLCVFVSFLGYNLLSELGRAFGWDTLRRWVFSRHSARDEGDA